ncbi:MAG: hypothetical protein JXR49_19505 [Acidobacteria bacterium]|nr:hypothetical protein [Acidobacteriota bacterium]
MSEYQYYEFQAVDRPLDDRQMRELRAVSSRAVITPTSFTNEYNWGDFKGSPDKWMEKYFDAFLYLANWGTRRFMLRFPKRLLDAKALAAFCAGDSASLRTRGDYVILSFETEIEDDDWVEPEGSLASLIPLRSEILRGDLRCLYLAWLLCVQNGEVDDDEPEPCIPPNLHKLSASESSFADFLGIDSNLIEVAARASSKATEDTVNHKKLESWVYELPEDEKDTLLLRLLDDDPQLGTELRTRFAKQTQAGKRSGHPSNSENRRTAGELLLAVEELAEEKKHRAAERAAAEKKRLEKEKAAARAKYLDNLAQKADKVWRKVHDLISTKQPAKYDEAVKLLVDLRDLAAHQGDIQSFQLRHRELCEKNAKKPSLLRRMEKSGL